MAKSTSTDTTAEAKENVVPINDPVYIGLNIFAQANAKKYGIELMGGFYHTQEALKHRADIEENWHKLIKDYAGREAK